MERKTNISVMDNLGIRREVYMEVGPSVGYASGNILDANAVSQLIEDKINAVIGGASASLDTLKELGDAIPTKLSDLENDIASSQPFPESWTDATSIGNGESQNSLVYLINRDSDAIVGKSYLGTVSYSDLPVGLLLAELKVEIMDVNPNAFGDNKKVILFTLTSSGIYPYHWEATSTYGEGIDWKGYAPINKYTITKTLDGNDSGSTVQVKIKYGTNVTDGTYIWEGTPMLVLVTNPENLQYIKVNGTPIEITGTNSFKSADFNMPSLNTTVAIIFEEDNSAVEEE